MRKNLIRKIIGGFGVIVFLVLVMLWLAGAFRHKINPGQPEPASPAPQSATAVVELMQFPMAVEQSGTIHSRIETNVSSRIMAQVVEILTLEGAQVATNGSADQATLMARLDDRDIKAKLQQAQSQSQALAQAIESATSQIGSAQALLQATIAKQQQTLTDYQRYENLYNEKVTTAQQLDLARAAKDVAMANRDAAEKTLASTESEVKRLTAQKQQADDAVAEAAVTLSYTLIRTPISGRVAKRMIETGDTVSPGQTLFTVESNSQPELHAVVSESLLADLHVGDKVAIKIDAVNLTCQGAVREIIPWSDPATRTVLAKIALPADPKLVSGMYGRLYIPRGDYKTLVIPAAAVKKVGQLDLVNVICEGTTQRRFVTLGKTHDGFVEILSGLSQGEKVALP